MPMDTIQADKAVTIRFNLHTHLRDGSLKAHPEETITFIFGVDRQVSTLEKALEGRSVGELFNLDIPASEIYGEHDPSLIRLIPKKGLIKQRLREGKVYRQMKMGSLLSFKVLEVREDAVLADFNKPLTGISVSLDVEVMQVRDATEKEIKDAVEAQIKRAIGCG